MENRKKSNGINKNLLTVLAIIAVIAIIVVVIVVVSSSKKGSSIQLGEEVKLTSNEVVNLKNGDDKISLVINSEIAPVEGEECKVEYTLTVNGTEYKGDYTFATGYSIHSEPTNIPYKVSFVGVELGSVTISVNQAQQQQ